MSPKAIQSILSNSNSKRQGLLVEQEEEGDVDNEEEEQVVKSKSKASVAKNSPKSIQKITPTSSTKRRDLMERYAKIAAKNRTLRKKSN
jgi:hypothetical protein